MQPASSVIFLEQVVDEVITTERDPKTTSSPTSSRSNSTISTPLPGQYTRSPTCIYMQQIVVKVKQSYTYNSAQLIQM